MLVIFPADLGVVFWCRTVELHVFPAGVSEHLSRHRTDFKPVGLPNNSQVFIKGVHSIVELNSENFATEVSKN